MNALWIFLAALPVSLLGILAFIVMIAAGFRNGDKTGFTSPPRNRIDSIARRMTGVGIRRDHADND